MREDLKQAFLEFKTELQEYATLIEIFNDRYFNDLERQLVKLSSDYSTHINPVFLVYLRDKDEGKTFLKRLNNYIQIVFNKTASVKIKKHIAGQLRTIAAHDTLVELSVLGNLLLQLPPQDIELFPTTVDDHDVEAKIKIDGRWIYLEVSTLGDTQEDRNEITELLRTRRMVGKGKWLDLNKDGYRIVGKSARKSKQFAPDTPNVLLIVLTGTRTSMHDFFRTGEDITVNDISCLFEFNCNLRHTNTRIGLSPNQLTENEKNKLNSLFTSKDWLPLIKLS